jgi:hypothetical protein
MNSDITRLASSLLLVLATCITGPSQAAKPADKGGGNNNGGDSTEEAAAADPPEFFWATFDHVNRHLRLQGKDLITGEEIAPVFPQVFIGGEPILTIDESASAATTDFSTNEGAVLVSFDSVLDALGTAEPPLGLKVLPAGDNWEVKAVTSAGTALLSAYFPRTLREVPADTGVCPCAAEYGVYDKVDVAPDATFCSSTQGISEDEYIEAGYGRLDGSAVIIGSHRSWSNEDLYTSSCYARDLSQIVAGEETPQYLGGSPIPVGDGDHALCVALIKSAEPLCNP